MRLLVWVLSFMVILGGCQIKCCLQNERVELLRIKSYFSSISDPENDFGDPLSSWDEKSNCCGWERVKCNASSGRITHLFLNSTVSPHKAWPLNMNVFYSFQELSTLHLSSNGILSLVQIEGLHMLNNLQDLNLRSNEIHQLPDFLLNLPSLQVLDLSSCQVTGKLDARLCRLRNLRELYLPNNNLHGILPDCLWNLTSLQVVDLLGNSFTGNLPSSINLPSLEWLSIKDNYFTGKYSLSSLTNHSTLKVLMLSNNFLQVQIEKSLTLSTMQLQVLGLANCGIGIHTDALQKLLFLQSNLEYIDLSGNSLVGLFPTWLLQNNSDLKLVYLEDNSLTGGLQLPKQNNLSLVLLDISSNQFSGELPNHIGMTLSALKLLQISHNSFHGPIPSSLSNMTQLEILDLSNNNISGEVPDSMFSYCSRLGILVLSNNKLHGEIIPSNMNLPSLYVLSLDNNLFVGALKESLKTSSVLEYLDISKNKATGDLPSWIGRFSQLKLMFLASNNLHGNIPSQICNMTSLQYLDLSHNRFDGEIPSCGCPSLLYLLLGENKLTGAIPKGLSRGTNLKALDLGSNQLLGGVPTWINLLSNLVILILRDNQLQGELPIQLCQSQHLNIMDLSDNGISGTIPSCLRNLSFGAVEEDLFDAAKINVLFQPSSTLFELRNHYIFRDDTERADFKFEKVELIWSNRSYPTKAGYKFNFLFADIDLSCNQLTGFIPSELGELTELIALNVSHNRLSGPIPKSFSKLRSMEALDFSWNKLSGTIPSQLADLFFLAVFNVSYNNLSGQVPDTGQFSTFDESSYLGNPLLCGQVILSINCTAMKPSSIREPTWSPPIELKDEGRDTAFDLKVFFWSFGASFTAVLVVFSVVMYVNLYWRRAWFAFLDTHLLWWLYK